MKEYIKDNMKLYNLDCMEGMAEYPDDYFDLCIVDPPYGIGEDGAKKRTSPKRPNSYENYKKHTDKNWDSEPPKKRIFYRVKKSIQTSDNMGGQSFYREYF